jgi:primary-amine oxidase
MVVNPSRRNAVGQPTGYKIMPGVDVARPFAQEDASLLRRAGFIRHNLWITAYDPAQRHAAGDYINQNSAPDGLDQWIKRMISRSRIRISSPGTPSACTIFHGRRTGR